MKNNKLVMGSEVMRLFSEMKQEDLEIDLNDIKLISKDIDISSALNKIERSVAGREYFIKSIRDESNDELLQKIESIFLGVKFNRIFNHILKARYYGFSCFEIVYGEEYNVESLIPLPHSKIKYDKKDKKWYMEDGNTKIDITYDKFLLAIHNWRPDKVTGHSIFEVCNSSFKDKELFRNQLRGIARKYGETIMITGYDPEEDEKELEKKAEKLKEMEGKAVMMMPVEFLGRSNGATLKDSLHIIKLSDLDPEIYTKLEKTEKLKLIQNILGSTLTIDVGNVGSQALGTVHMEAEEQVVEECCSFISDTLQNLLEAVLPLHGYEHKEFYFSLEKKRDISKELEFEKETEIVTNQKIMNVSQLVASGYPLSKEYVAEYLGIDVSQIKDPVLEFASKKKDLDSLLDEKRAIKSKVLKQAEESFLKSFSSNLKEQLISQLSKTSKSFLKPLEFNFDTFYDHALIVKLIAYLEEGESVVEFGEEVNPFEMKFHEAIKYAVEKKPKLIDEIDIMQEEVRAQAFWVKRSTEITSTEKLMKDLQKNLDNGGTYKEWLKDISDVADRVGMGNDGWYSANVYRTNMLSFYNAGVYQQQMDNVDNQPYWLYDGIADGRQSDICKELDGKVYAAEDPVWSKIYPPGHYQCRSGIVALSEEEVEAMGLRVTKPSKKVKEMDLGSFEGNPANSYWKKLEKNVIIKDKKLEGKINNFLDETDLEAKKKFFLNSKNVDSFLKTSKDNRRTLLKDILEANDMTELKIGIRKISDWGYCSYYDQKDRTKRYVEIVLNANDERTKESRLKTLLHEFTHLTGNGKLSVPKAVEETLAETIGHYTAGLYSNTSKIAVSYPEILVKTLPELKKIKGFEKCTTIESFGKKLFTELKKSDFNRDDMMKRLGIDTLNSGKTTDMMKLVYDNKNNLKDIEEHFLNVQLSNYSFMQEKIKAKYDSIINILADSKNLDDFIKVIGANNPYIPHIVGSIIKKGWF